MTTITMDPDLAKKLDAGMREGANDLPFPVVYIWALNGQAGYKAQGSAQYYGGWACKVDDLHSLMDQGNLTLPQDWKQTTISSRDGDEYEAFTTRHIIVAPIGKRHSWLLDGKRYNDYIEGGRRHLQVLAYMADAVGENGSKDYHPWGPVVLTAKGYQARNLLDAFAKWEKATATIRRRVAPGIPAWCFYLALGTFERDRRTVMVGKPSAQSPITPISAYIPERLTDELIGNLFVGEQVAQNMAHLQDQAAEWLNAWRETALDEEDYNGEDEIP